jgi:endogenous inhibitor of DNA gyrase (YacG/DUF329 family)
MSSNAPIVFILIGVVVALAIAFWRTRTTHFECPSCGRSFKVSVIEYFLAQAVLGRPGGDDRYVPCPYCHASVLMTPILDRTR